MGKARTAVFLAAAVVLPAGRAQAVSCRPNLIPNGTKFSCLTCHMSSTGGLNWNPFGLAVKAVVTPGSCAPFWSAQLAALDSDGDGRTNGEELQDPNGVWRVGQPNPGTSSLVSNPGVPNPRFRRGDPNSDGIINLTDAIDVLSYLFRSGPVPACRSAADANDNGAVDLSDAVLIILHLFASQPPNPKAPFPDCGIEVVTDTLDCKSFTACQ